LIRFCLNSILFCRVRPVAGRAFVGAFGDQGANHTGHWGRKNYASVGLASHLRPVVLFKRARGMRVDARVFTSSEDVCFLGLRLRGFVSLRGMASNPSARKRAKGWSTELVQRPPIKGQGTGPHRSVLSKGTKSRAVAPKSCHLDSWSGGELRSRPETATKCVPYDS